MRAASDSRAKTSAKEISYSNKQRLFLMSRATKPQKIFKTHKAPRYRGRRPQPSSRATYTDLVTIGALFLAIILVVTLGFQYTLG